MLELGKEKLAKKNFKFFSSEINLNKFEQITLSRLMSTYSSKINKVTARDFGLS